MITAVAFGLLVVVARWCMDLNIIVVTFGVFVLS